MEFEINIKIWKEGKFFVVEAIDIPLASQGKTFHEAKANFADAFLLSIKEPSFLELVEKTQPKKEESLISSLFIELPRAIYETTDIIGAKINQIA